MARIVEKDSIVDDIFEVVLQNNNIWVTDTRDNLVRLLFTRQAKELVAKLQAVLKQTT